MYKSLTKLGFLLFAILLLLIAPIDAFAQQPAVPNNSIFIPIVQPTERCVEILIDGGFENPRYWDEQLNSRSLHIPAINNNIVYEGYLSAQLSYGSIVSRVPFKWESNKYRSAILTYWSYLDTTETSSDIVDYYMPGFGVEDEQMLNLLNPFIPLYSGVITNKDKPFIWTKHKLDVTSTLVRSEFQDKYIYFGFVGGDFNSQPFNSEVTFDSVSLLLCK